MVVHGQVSKGAITGNVLDPSGAAVPNASVVARNVATGVTTKVSTDTSGAYLIPYLPIGEYSLTVEAQGFKSTEQLGLRVVAGNTITLNVHLELGAVAQTVQVSGAPPTVDFTKTTAGNTQLAETIANLPIMMAGTARAATDLMAAMPGVTWRGITGSVIMGTGDSGSNANAIRFTTDGQFASLNFTQGLRDDSGILPDMVQEFRVLTNATAEQGWSEGTGIELITKSGTNKFHGSAFEYLRNNVFDSRGFIASKTPIERHNEFGGTFGGPIKKNKIFFIASFDGFELRTAGSGTNRTVPTALMRNGDFTEALGAQIGSDALGRPIYKGEIYDPLTTRTLPNGTVVRDPFMYNGQLNVIDPARFSNISKTFQSWIPMPTRAGVTANWVGVTGSSPIGIYRTFGKLDSVFGRHRVMFGYEDTPHYLEVDGPYPGWEKLDAWFGDGFIWNGPRTVRVRLADTVTLKPNLLLSARVATNQALRTWGAAGSVAGSSAKGLIKGALTPDVPRVSIAEGLAFGTYLYSITCPQGTLPAAADLTWVKGHHNAKFGGEYVNEFTHLNFYLNTEGQYNFPVNGTGLPSQAGTGYGYASYLLGAVGSVTMATPNSGRTSQNSWGFYAQDSWKATKKLTVNYGLRWDIFVSGHESYNRIGAMSPSVVNPAAGGRLGALTFWGFGPGRNGRTGIMDTYYGSLGPRLGLAYQLTKRTVLRASYGIDTWPNAASEFSSGGGQAPNFGFGATVSQSSLDSFTPVLYWDNGVNILPPVPNLNPSLLNRSSVPMIIPSDNQQGRVQLIGATVEHEVGMGMVLSAQYVGKLTHGMVSNNLARYNDLPLKYLSLGSLLFANINSPAAQAAGISVPYAGFTGSVAQALRPYPQYQGVAEVNAPDGYSTYHAVLLSASKRFSNGLSFLISDTIGKIVGVTSPYSTGTLSTWQNTIQHGAFLNTAKGVAPWNPGQQLKFSYSYDLPVGRGRAFLKNTNAIVDGIVGGWTIAGIHDYYGGTHLVVSGRQSIPGVGGVWPLRVPGVPIRTGLGCGSIDPNNPAQNRYLNPSAFTPPAPFTFGNVYVLSSTIGCPNFNENISILKNFNVRESLKLNVGADFFNAFNRHTLGGLITDTENPDFGRYTSGAGALTYSAGAVSAGRTVQLHMKLEF